MLMMQKYVLLQKAAQKIFYGTLVKTPLLYSLTYTSSRAILPFVKQWIVFNTCNINNYFAHERII
jgi:hypothetical protein